MNLTATLAAAGAAILGAIIWSVVTVSTGYEVGIVAWAVGGLVGMGARWMDGNGPTMGAICAGFALLAIILGKLLASQVMLSSWAKEMRSEEMYQEYMTDARDFESVERKDYGLFIITHDYGWDDYTRPEEISAEEMAYFEDAMAPKLRRWAEQKPDYSTWLAEEEVEIKREHLGMKNVAAFTVANLAFFDIIFGLLGIVTAFQIVNSAEEDAV